MRFNSGHKLIEELNKFIENDMFDDALALVQTFGAEGCIDLHELKKLQLKWEDLCKEKADSPNPEKNYVLEFRRLKNRYFECVDKPNCYQFEHTNETVEVQEETNFSKEFDDLLQKNTEAVKIFISYAHEDRRALQKLHKALGNMKLQKLIDVWDDGEIEPGIIWESEIFETIEKTDIVLLLISPAFISSYYCMKKELDALLARHSEEEGALSIIPIYLMDGEYKGAPFCRFQWIPKKKKYIDSYKSQQRGFNEVAKELRVRVEKLFEIKNLAKGFSSKI